MDWIRRNWPDLLIGIALFSVITGIVATLLSGGTLIPQHASGTGPDSKPTIQKSDSYSESLSEPINASARSFRGQETTPVTAAVNVVPSTSVQEETFIAAQPISAPVTTTTAATITNNNANSGSNTTATTTTPVAVPQATPTRVEAETPVPSSQNDDLTNTSSEAKIYKVSMGTFGNPDNANRLLNEMSNTGYKAGIEKSGSYSVVYLGPFTSQSQADEVANRLKASNYDVRVYSQGTDKPVASQVTATPTSASAASSGRSYLQVGAYASSDSAVPQRSQLEQLGYKVMEHRENGFVKLMVGPYGLNELTTIKTQLATQGIDSFQKSIQ